MTVVGDVLVVSMMEKIEFSTSLITPKDTTAAILGQKAKENE